MDGSAKINGNAAAPANPPKIRFHWKKFPPFATLIKISITGTKDEVFKMVENIKKLIEPYEIDVFPAFIPQAKGKYGVNGIIKINKKNWPNTNLIEKLRSLPMNVLVNVDPDSLI